MHISKIVRSKLISLHRLAWNLLYLEISFQILIGPRRNNKVQEIKVVRLSADIHAKKLANTVLNCIIQFIRTHF